MPAKFTAENNGICLFQVSGMLREAELESAQSECETVIKELGEIKILILLDDFQGWEKSKSWDNFSFAQRNDSSIEKLAIVGDEKWRDMAYMFTLKGLRPVPIEYFRSGQELAARQWLNKVE